MTERPASQRQTWKFATIDLNLLKVFEALLQERSVSLAAERLNLTQPAVSNALNRLRVTFEDELFVRTRNGMEPTSVTLALADSILHGLATIRSGVAQNLTFDPRISSRRFTIITTDVGEATFVGQLLRILNREAPHIDIRVLEASREEYERLLDSGDADFALGRFRIADTFRCELIGSCRYVAIMCSQYAAALGLGNGDTIARDTFLKAAHVHVVPRGATENPIEPALGSDAAQRRVALMLPHTSVLSAILPGTELVATIPEPAVASLSEGGKLVWAALPFETEITQLFMGWHKRHDGDKGHIWMREKIRSIEII